MVLPNVVEQLVIATVAGGQARNFTNRLNENGFYVTEIDSSGGILNEAMVSLLVGLERSRLPVLLDVVRECCHTRHQFIPVHVEAPLLEIQPAVIEAETGGALIYVLDVERFEQI